jgi:hypothetical protein
VLCAFVAGLMIASIVNGRPDNTLGAMVQVAALLGLFYCLIHLFVTNVIVAGRIRRREMAEAEGVELDEDFEDELVYREESATPKRKR